MLLSSSFKGSLSLSQGLSCPPINTLDRVTPGGVCTHGGGSERWFVRYSMSITIPGIYVPWGVKSISKPG